jgi:hypothetical protein
MRGVGIEGRTDSTTHHVGLIFRRKNLNQNMKNIGKTIEKIDLNKM